MINRQSIYNALFKLKNSGVDVSDQLKIMETRSGIPKEVIGFLQDQSPQFQFYRSIQKHQRALMKNILHYEELDVNSKIKVCSSLITRAMISVEYHNLDESLLEDLRLDKLSRALHKALSDKDYSYLDEVLQGHKNAMMLFYKGKVSEESGSYKDQ